MTPHNLPSSTPSSERSAAAGMHERKPAEGTVIANRSESGIPFSDHLIF